MVPLIVSDVGHNLFLCKYVFKPYIIVNKMCGYMNKICKYLKRKEAI